MKTRHPKPDPIIVPADIYDAHELSALAFGGVGRRQYFSDKVQTIPCCIIGHGRAMRNVAFFPGEHACTTLYDAIENDAAVARINRRRSKLISTRVSWRAYCKERNIVRGEHTAFPDLEPTP